MTKLISTIISVFVIFIAVSAHAWLYYSKPEFRGRVIDAETKQPIEGAVVVVVYNKWEFGGPGGGNTVPFDAKETLTNQDGDFNFPSYKTMIGPLSRVSDVSFIIYKPRYMSVNRIEGINIPDEKYFAIGKDVIGIEGEIKYVDTRFAEPVAYTWKGFRGIAELKKAKTNEERRKTRPSRGGLDEYQLPLFFKILEEEYKHVYN